MGESKRIFETLKCVIFEQTSSISPPLHHWMYRMSRLAVFPIPSAISEMCGLGYWGGTIEARFTLLGFLARPWRCPSINYSQFSAPATSHQQKMATKRRHNPSYLSASLMAINGCKIRKCVKAFRRPSQYVPMWIDAQNSGTFDRIPHPNRPIITLSQVRQPQRLKTGTQHSALYQFVRAFAFT